MSDENKTGTAVLVGLGVIGAATLATHFFGKSEKRGVFGAMHSGYEHPALFEWRTVDPWRTTGLTDAVVRYYHGGGGWQRAGLAMFKDGEWHWRAWGVWGSPEGVGGVAGSKEEAQALADKWLQNWLVTQEKELPLVRWV